MSHILRCCAGFLLVGACAGAPRLGAVHGPGPGAAPDTVEQAPVPVATIPAWSPPAIPARATPAVVAVTLLDAADRAAALGGGTRAADALYLDDRPSWDDARLRFARPAAAAGTVTAMNRVVRTEPDTGHGPRVFVRRRGVDGATAVVVVQLTAIGGRWRIADQFVVGAPDSHADSHVGAHSGSQAAAGRGAAERSAGVVDGGTISGGPGGGVLTVGLRVSVDGRPGVPASSSTLPRPYRIVSTPAYDPTDYLAGLCPNARGFDGLGWWWTVDVVDRATGAIVQSRVTCVPIPGPGTIGSGPVVAQPPHLGDIWQHAPIRPPTLGLSPPNEGVTGLDTRYWSTSPSVVDIDVTLAGWRVRGRAVRRAVAIDPGEGPVQFRPDGGSANRPAAHHVYERHGSYVVQSAALWDATVTLSGHGFTSGRPTSIGTAIVSVSGTYPVVEVRSVLTG